MDILHCLIFSWLQAGMAERWSSMQKIYLISYLTTDGKSHSEENISNQLFLEQPAISIYPCLSINLLFSLFLFSLNQFAAKDLDRKSKKCEKEEKAEKLKLKKVSTTPIKIKYCKQNYYSYLPVSTCSNCITPQGIIKLLSLFTLIYIFPQAIQKGNLEGAKIHAENSIRQKNQVSKSIS